MLWFNKLVAPTLPAVPRPIVRRLSARYIAGETLAEAVACVRQLNRKGYRATLDVLGEFVITPAEAERAGQEYLQALETIDREKLDSNVSLKLTQMGLKIDADLCHRITRTIVARARELGNFVRIDMEDSSCTSDTLAIYRKLSGEWPGTVGCVIQSYLRRSAADVARLVREGANIRLCKGIYVEPAEIAFQSPAEVNRSFREILVALLEGGTYTGIATHDDSLITHARETIDRLGLSRDRYEFQMLLGVRENLRDEVLAAGHRMRIYVPFGSHWYAYSVRRLKENPQIAGHVLRGLLNGKS
jgi:proline dehydrogenase